MNKIHCLNAISAQGTALLTDNYQLTDNLAEANGILVRSAAMHDMDLPDGLLAIARAGAGVNNIPLDKCAEQGIVVFNTPGANANAVKELVIGAMMLNSIVAALAQELVDSGMKKPPIFYSANLDGGDELNQKLYDEYKESIHYSF